MEGKDDMDYDWDRAMDSLSRIAVSSNANNEPVTISGSACDLKCVGVGTDAAVFQSLHEKAFAYKKYAKDKIAKVKVEAEVYKKLGDSPYISTYYAHYDDILVLSYEEGPTLFDCILQGIHIPEQVIQDVENARAFVRSKGLNPRDIHLKNILLQDGRAKILDVSEYKLPGNDNRWEDLKTGYKQFYHLIDGKPVPFWLVETIRKWYHQRENNFSTHDDFIRFVVQLLHRKQF